MTRSTLSQSQLFWSVALPGPNLGMGHVIASCARPQGGTIERSACQAPRSKGDPTLADPLTLGALGALALSEGIKFLYDQARTVLQRWRDKRDTNIIEVAASTSPVLDAPLTEAAVPEALVAANAESLSALRRALMDYAEEGRAADPSDRDLLSTVDALRRVLEVVYSQRITFKGEQRDSTGTTVDVAVEAQVVEGYLAGLRSRGGLDDITAISSEMSVDRVAVGGEAVGIDLNPRAD